MQTILPDDSDRPGHLPAAVVAALAKCHSMPHTVSFSGWHPVPTCAYLNYAYTNSHDYVITHIYMMLEKWLIIYLKCSYFYILLV